MRVSPAGRLATTGSSAQPAPSSPSQHSSSAPAANLISLADDDSPDAPDIFSVDPVADQLVQDGATALAGSVPLLMVTCRVQANDDPATALVDSGAGINVIDRFLLSTTSSNVLPTVVYSPNSTSLMPSSRP